MMSGLKNKPMRQPELNRIYVGLKFTSVHFSADAEIKAIREKENQCDVMLTSSEGQARIEKDWNLQHVKWGFENGEYKPLEPNGVNISVY
jgi:hypothetical protein